MSETTKTEEYSVTYKTNSEAAIGSMEYTGSPHIGKTARLWKVIYEDGEEVGKEQINDSYYKSQIRSLRWESSPITRRHQRL